MASFPSLALNRQKLVQIGAFGVIILLAFALGTPRLPQPKMQLYSGEAPRQEFVAPLATPAASQVATMETAAVLRRISKDAAKSRAKLPQASEDDRKVIRTGSLSLIVPHPAEQVERITQIAQTHGGYVVQSQVSGERERETGAITIRVPAAQFDAVRKELKGIAKTVEQETTTADDVTMRLAENEATLRNYRAEEVSYIEIMKRSGKISDTLEVAQQLADVRGRIERLAAEIRTMNLQSEMTAITISLRTEPVVLSNNAWRPLYELKLAWNDGTGALAEYATAMMAFVLRLPAVAAWAFTLFIGLKIGLKLLKKIAHSFGLLKPASAPQQAH